MPAASRTLLLIARMVLVVGLLSGLLFTQTGYARLAAAACATTADAPSVNVQARNAASCGHCCKAMPCCALSQRAPDAPSRPEPISHERTQQTDHAPVFAATFTLVSAFFFPAPPLTPLRVVGADCALQPLAFGAAPRGAVSCIWLI